MNITKYIIPNNNLDNFELLQDIIAELENPIKYLDMWLEIELLFNKIKLQTENINSLIFEDL